jgi:hypothetical protein
VLSGIDAVARRQGITHPMALTRLAEIGLATLNADDGPAPLLRGDEYAAIVVHLDAQPVRLDLDWAVSVPAQRLPRAERATDQRRQPPPAVSYKDWIVPSETASLIA